jgi:phosphoglycerol transferase MdoB-like AlkP superfamily enzyme
MDKETLTIIYNVCLSIFSLTLKSMIPYTIVYFIATRLNKNLGWEYYLNSLVAILFVLLITFHVGRRIRIFLTGKDKSKHGDLD